MLEITPIQTKEEQKDICGLCGVEFNFDYLAYSAKENGKLLGISQFRIFGDCGVIYDLANAGGVDDFDALVIMGKAALDFMLRCGVKNTRIKINNAELIKAIIDQPCKKTNADY